MAEVHKCLNNISPVFTWEYFKQKHNPYSLRNTQPFKLGSAEQKLIR